MTPSSSSDVTGQVAETSLVNQFIPKLGISIPRQFRSSSHFNRPLWEKPVIQLFPCSGQEQELFYVVELDSPITKDSLFCGPNNNSCSSFLYWLGHPFPTHSNHKMIVLSDSTDEIVISIGIAFSHWAHTVLDSCLLLIISIQTPLSNNSRSRRRRTGMKAEASNRNCHPNGPKESNNTQEWVGNFHMRPK